MDDRDVGSRHSGWRSLLVRALVVVALWSIPAFVSTWVAFDQDSADEHGLGWYAARYSLPWLEWAVLTPVVWWCVRRWPLAVRGRALHVAVHLLIGLVLGGVWLLTGAVIGVWLDTGGVDAGALRERLDGAWVFGFWGVMFYWVTVAGVSAVEAGRRAEEQRAHASRLEVELGRARLRWLRSQLQPHFLFNTLNSISSLVRQDRRDDAVEMINRLSALLRRVLRQDQDEMIGLDEEVELVGDYLGIEQTRLGERLRVSIEIEPAARRARIPALLLQPLVENAIVHGVSRLPEGGRVELRASAEDGRLRVRIENDGPPLDGAPIPTDEGIGVHHTRVRLETLFGSEQWMSMRSRAEGGVAVEIEIPLVEDGA